MRKKWGGLFAVFLILVMVFGIPLRGYAEESKSLGELVPMIFAFDSEGNPIQEAMYATPIAIDEQTTFFVTSAYMCELEHSGGYAIFYYQNGEVAGAPVKCIYQNTDVGYALFETSDGTTTGLGLNCADMGGITEGTPIGYMGYAEDGSVNLYENYCSGYADGVGWFGAPCVMPAYGGPVVETENLYVIGFIVTENLFITMEQVYSDIFSGETSGDGYEDEVNTSGENRDEQAANDGGSAAIVGSGVVAFLIVGGIVSGIIILIVRKKKNKNTKPMPKEQMVNPMVNPQGYVDVRPVQQEKIYNLIAIGGVHAGAVIPVTEPIVFGRDKNRCNLLFPSTTQGISNIHCQITKINGRIEITDLGSTYGTFLDDGTKVMPHMPYTLISGQGFYLADRQYSYRIQ